MASPPSAVRGLCSTLYAYIRRRGSGHEDAQDLTQGFLLQLLEHDAFNRVERSCGRFRSFLLASLNYYLAHQRDHAGAQARRGPGSYVAGGVRRGATVPVGTADTGIPERLFERRWALALLDQVLQRLGQEFQEAGKGALFRRLQDFLATGQAEARYPDAAADLGMSVDPDKKAAQRMRQRYYELFREEIAQTVADPGEVEDELRYLCEITAG